MVSTDNQELFERYYQKEYDFNTTNLTDADVYEIKKLAKEKRVDYALAPIGDKVFEIITSNEPGLRFEFIDFESEKIDGMLYIPKNGEDKAYIILNSKKPLINQIFTTMHEYYHYIHDYAEIKDNPYICNFSSLENVNEKRASRFAAEFVLPEEALRAEVKYYSQRVKGKNGVKLDYPDYAAISILLTLKYQLPLKAVIYRLYEEKYINDVDIYIENYSFIKDVISEIEIASKRVEVLYSCDNPFFEGDSILYMQMKSAYITGLASREEILRDTDILGLDRRIVEQFFDDFATDDGDDDDDDLIAIIQDKWRK